MHHPCIVILALGLLAVAAPAQDPVPPDKADSNCRCCELSRVYAPYLKELPPPVKRDGIGSSHLKITTKSAEAQEWFDQGLNLLHCFWEFEAYRCFLQAAEADPDCAMAYWGICLALPGARPEAGEERGAALVRAKELSGNASPREQLYIKAVDALLTGGSRAAVAVMRDLLRAHPDDREARAFLAFWLRDGYSADGVANPGTVEALGILREALAQHPRHAGLHHYNIHILESGPDFEHARASAETLATLAPQSGHIVHMPGHIYYLAGEYNRAARSFQDCHKIETAYLSSQKIPAVDCPNHLHNLHYLAYAAAEAGRYAEALKIANEFKDVHVAPDRRWSAGAGQIYHLASMLPAFIHLRFGDEAAAFGALQEHQVPDDSFAIAGIGFLQHYCALKQRLRTGADPESSDMIDLRFAMEKAGREFIDHRPGGKSSAEAEQWSIAAASVRILLAEIRPWLKPVDTAPATLGIWMDSAVQEQTRQGYREPPLTPWPVEESFGRLLAGRGHHAEARKWFEKALTKRASSGFSSLGLARSHAAEHSHADAANQYRLFLEAWKNADPERPELAEAREFLKQFP